MSKDRPKAKPPKAPKVLRPPEPPPPSPPKPPKPGKGEAGGVLAQLRRLVDVVAGARLCYGEPVEAGGRTVIPVARVRATGGYGFGRGEGGAHDAGEGSGGGGGGHLDAQPVGFIEVGADGARYHEIPDPDRVGRNLKAGAAAVSALLAAGAGARRVGRRRRPRSAGLLGR